MHLQNLKESAAQKFYKDLMNKIPLLLEDLSQVQTPNTIVLLTKEVDRNCKMLFKKENNSWWVKPAWEQVETRECNHRTIPGLVHNRAQELLPRTLMGFWVQILNNNQREIVPWVLLQRSTTTNWPPSSKRSRKCRYVQVLLLERDKLLKANALNLQELHQEAWLAMLLDLTQLARLQMLHQECTQEMEDNSLEEVEAKAFLAHPTSCSVDSQAINHQEDSTNKISQTKCWWVQVAPKHLSSTTNKLTHNEFAVHHPTLGPNSESVLQQQTN